MLQPRLINVVPENDLKLRLSYETGEVRLFDVSPYVSGPWFGELNNEAYFHTVRALPDGKGIEWMNGQDIAPHELYRNSILIGVENSEDIATPEDLSAHKVAMEEYIAGETVSHDDIDWN